MADRGILASMRFAIFSSCRLKGVVTNLTAANYDLQLYTPGLGHAMGPWTMHDDNDSEDG